jgi:multidrug efflux pump subunit AcrA (membrane-fusion protein)
MMETSAVTPIPKSSSFRFIILGCCAVLLVLSVSAGLLWARSVRIQSQRTALAQINSLGPRVFVMRVEKPQAQRGIPFPASIHGYIETSIYAKTAGYLKTINVDKGDLVRAGEVLAVLRSPELDKQVADAKANYWLQEVTDGRNQQLVSEQVIPQQTADNSHAAMLQAKATYEQLSQRRHTKGSEPRATASLPRAMSILVH